MSADDVSVSREGPVRGYRTAHLLENPQPAYRLIAERFDILAEVGRARNCVEFAGLQGKTQMVFLGGRLGASTRLSHSLEVAELSAAVAARIGLSASVAYVCGLVHDCGHGPGGHSFERFRASLPGWGFDHAAWGSDRVARRFGFGALVRNAIANHSWENSAPAFAEAEIVSWMDRVAYLTGDWRDAVALGLVTRKRAPLAFWEDIDGWSRAIRHKVMCGLVQGYRETGFVCIKAGKELELDSLYLRTISELYTHPGLVESDHAVRRSLDGSFKRRVACGMSVSDALDEIYRMSDRELVVDAREHVWPSMVSAL